MSILEKAQEIYSEATSDEYVTNEESYYVALGDSSAEGDSYVDMFASKLYLDESKYNNSLMTKLLIVSFIFIA